MIYDSSNLDNSGERMSMCEVVITSYHEVIKSLPQPDANTIQEWINQKLDVDEMTFVWTEKNLENAGLLHEVPWYRVSVSHLLPLCY